MAYYKCRICLKCKVLQDLKILEYESDHDTLLTIYDMLLFCAPQLLHSISKNDMICLTCLLKLIDCVAFLEQCIESAVQIKNEQLSISFQGTEEGNKCNITFDADNNRKPAELIDDLNPDWVPSQNMGYTRYQEISRCTKVDRFKRQKKKLCIEESQTASQIDATGVQGPETSSSCAEESAEETLMNANVALKSTQTNLTVQDITDQLLNLAIAKEKVVKLQKVTLTIKNLENDDMQTKYFTGLPNFKVFNIIVKHVAPFIKIHPNMCLPVPEQILLTLVKLRLNLDFKDIAYRFGVSPFTASTYFKNILHHIYVAFKDFIVWPEREVLMKTMPTCFKESFHQKTTVIIDCFEIRCERASDLLAAAECWSNYKHSQTIKYLIGITPQGSICFISEGWGGRTSDKIITQNSFFLNHLNAGDVVMADRGFLIKEFVELYRAPVKIPAFTRGKDQLHPIDLENTRAIAHVRIHIERVIGLIRLKYRILCGPVTITTLATSLQEPILDEIVFVCCVLINLCPPIVPLE